MPHWLANNMHNHKRSAKRTVSFVILPLLAIYQTERYDKTASSAVEWDTMYFFPVWHNVLTRILSYIDYVTLWFL